MKAYDGFDLFIPEGHLVIPEDKGWAPAWVLALAGQIWTCQITCSNRKQFRIRKGNLGLALRCKHCSKWKSAPSSHIDLKNAVVNTFLHHVKRSCVGMPSGIKQSILTLNKARCQHTGFWKFAWYRLYAQQERFHAQHALVAAGPLGISDVPGAQTSSSPAAEVNEADSAESLGMSESAKPPVGTLADTAMARAPDASTEPAVDVGPSPHTPADSTIAMDIFGDEPPSLDEAPPGSNYQDGVHLKAADLQQLLAEVKELKQNLHQLRNEQTEELRQLRFEFTNHAEKIQQVRDELIMGQQKICTRLDQLQEKIHSKDKNMDDVDGEGLGETPPQLRVAVSELYYI
jgi:hypothetical protein